MTQASPLSTVLTSPLSPLSSPHKNKTKSKKDKNKNSNESFFFPESLVLFGVHRQAKVNARLPMLMNANPALSILAHALARPSTAPDGCVCASRATALCLCLVQHDVPDSAPDDA